MTGQELAVSKQEQALTKEDKKKIWAFAIISVAFIVLYQIPYGRYVLYPISLLFTYVHEMGHGLTAILVGGSFDHFKMWADTSGVAYSYVPDSSFARALVAAGGLVNPAIVAAVFFVCGRYERAGKASLMVFGILAALSVVFLVRNVFGALYVTLLAAVCILAAVKLNHNLSQILIIILAIGLTTSTFAEGNYLFMDFGYTGDGKLMPSDTQNIAQNLFLPYWFWGGLVALISAAVLFFGVKSFFKKPKAKKALPK
ncbi:MAG: M50 family metallopeptidase [Bradymonadales bacterium]|jgi:hypothetical protein